MRVGILFVFGVEMKVGALSGTFRKMMPLIDVKARKDGSGGFEGYGSIFGNVDSYGDVVMPGAYKNTLPQFLVNGFATMGHAWSDIPVATFSDAREDDKGLYVVADFHSDDYSQRVRQVFQERIDRQKSVGLSVGFSINEGGAIYATDTDGFPTGIRLLKDLELFEVSIVNVPANPAALANNVKSRAFCEDPTCGCRLGGTHHRGLKFAEHAEVLLTELQGFHERVKAHTALRASQQRTPLEETQERVTAIGTELRSILDALEGVFQVPVSQDDTETQTLALNEIARAEILRSRELLAGVGE